ncbi:excisionase [Pseudofrankia sp. EUN1h]|nr:excisionase [Pseudofrankia sp. EUN1h]
MLIVGWIEEVGVSWDDRLDRWDAERELASRLEDSDWVTLQQATTRTGVSRAALRTWYRADLIPSRLVDGPHGPQRLVPLAMVAARAKDSPRLRRTLERRMSEEALIELLQDRIDALEARVAALERRDAGG